VRALRCLRIRPLIVGQALRLPSSGRPLPKFSTPRSSQPQAESDGAESARRRCRLRQTRRICAAGATQPASPNACMPPPTCYTLRHPVNMFYNEMRSDPKSPR
jgi:hypothetical protein